MRIRTMFFWKKGWDVGGEMDRGGFLGWNSQRASYLDGDMNNFEMVRSKGKLSKQMVVV
jgi:hypothetical protein